MTRFAHSEPPADADQRRSRKPVTVYTLDQLPPVAMDLYASARSSATRIGEIIVPPRDAKVFEVPKGHFFKILSVEGPQVGDVNLWNSADLSEQFYSGKTRALHASHITTGDRLWSTMPGFRPMATVTEDTLHWYGWDADGAGVHDVIGTRCDPYTNHMLKGVDYHYCCHSNLTRALSQARDLPLAEAERYVHDVLNLFMCTGYTLDTHEYFMKSSPVRPGDYVEFFSEIDLLVGLSTCPGGDCGSSHSDDVTPCYPLVVEICKPETGALAGWQSPPRSGYGGGHGLAD